MKLEAAGRSDSGLIRARNEDAILLRPEHRLFAVADGMGGHLAGNVASRLAVETIDLQVKDAALHDADVRILAERLVQAAQVANRTIIERGRADPELEGMGTTLTALAFPQQQSACAIAHVGDSRAYLWRAGRLAQLTHDHTWVQSQVDAGRLAPEQARGHPYASVLSRVLGMPDEFETDRLIIDVQPGDVFLLCSDGLTGMLSNDEIAAVLERNPAVDGMAGDLIDEANQRGGLDNITALLVRTT
jgi:protein phosphatase